jgi:preprotein translocase subunit SecY
MAQNNPAAAVQNIYRTPELWQKITFTFICLVLYRIGAHITVPGVDVVALTDFFKNRGGGGGILGLYDLFVGGGLSRATVFALGIMPYISSSIFMQIAEQSSRLSRRCRRTKRAGRKSRSGRAI